MSNWYMGELAARDRAVADAYAAQEQMQQRGFAFPQDALPPPPMGALADQGGSAGMQAGWLRNANAVRPLSGEGRTESEESRRSYNDPYSGMLETALNVLGPTKAGMKAAAVGLPLLAASTGEAEAAGLKGFLPGGILGLHPTSTAKRIHGKTLQDEGYSVNLPTGDVPTSGLMVGKYKNTDPRNTVVPREEFRQKLIRQHAETNAKALGDPNNYLGTWLSPEAKVYLDVSKRFDPSNIRAATKFGERTNQLAGRDIAKQADFPIGNWRGFVSSPEFRGRVDEMADVGRTYLNQFPTKEWWDMHGSSFEQAYGAKNLPQVAGFSAATAPVSNPYDNMRAMSVYMRRHLKGDPIIQPDYRIEPGGMGPWSAGKQIPLERSRIANLEKAAGGDLESMRRAKVREEAMAMSGDPNAVVLDRHWARITEAPERGIYANAQPGVINTNIPRRGVGDYDFAKGHISQFAREAGRDPRDYSADAWTGIRETIKRTNQLFGTPHRGSAITGESKSYQDVFQEIVEAKAKHLGISIEKLQARLGRGDADLLSGMLVGSPVLWKVFEQWKGSQSPKMGDLAGQDQYQ